MKFTEPLVQNRKLRWVLRCLLWSPILLPVSMELPLGGPIGRLAARYDVSKGHYELKTHGLLAIWRKDYAILLNDRYGVHLKTTAGCIVTGFQVSYDNGYNSVQQAAIIHKFGRDVNRECADDARAAWDKKHAEAATEERIKHLPQKTPDSTQP